MATSGKPEKYKRGLTLRSFVACLFSLFLMGMWIEYEECFGSGGGPFAENSPPNSAVAVILVVIGICAILYYIRKPLRLSKAELVVIYSALLVAAPLMTQGMWHRIFGLLAAIPHHQDFTSYESLPPMLWPHGKNLVRNNRFEQGLEGFELVGEGELSWQEIDRGPKGTWKSPVLSNDGSPEAKTWLIFTVMRHDTRGRETLVPGEPFLFSALVKMDGFVKGSACIVNMQADDDVPIPILTEGGTAISKATFANQGGFKRIGVNPVTIPFDLKEKLTIRIGIVGNGSMVLQDLQFFNMEAIESAYSGRNMVRESNLSSLKESERNSTVVRPDRMWSFTGLKYLFSGFIPLRQWLQPMIAWVSLVGALFLGFLGLNVLMRKQWVENERFTFPLTIFPKRLLAEEEMPEGGQIVRPIFHNRTMWLGFLITLPLALMTGIHFYFPNVPLLLPAAVKFADYVDSPVLKAYLQNVVIGGGGFGFGVSFCLLAIALLIETDVLFSLWLSFAVFQLWFMFGRMFHFNRFPGYPWQHQQHVGAFIAYALLAVFVARNHLVKVFKLVFGRTKDKEDGQQKNELVSYRTALAMVGISLVILALWGIWTKMGISASLLFFGFMLVCGFTAGKIRAECGAPFAYWTPYFSLYFVAAVGGFAVFESTGMLVATICSGFMGTSCFLLIAPVQVEMMELGRHFRVRMKDIGAGLTLGLFGGLLIGGFVVLVWAYGIGANNSKYTWPYEQNWYYNSYRAESATADRAFEAGTVGKNPETQPMNVVKNVNAKGLAIGAVVTGVLAFLRARFAWFPLHPLGYVMAPAHFMIGFWHMAFVAWVIRHVVLKIGGAKAIRHGLVPYAIGMFLACIASIMIFDVVGIWLQLHGVTDVYKSMP